MPHHADTVGHAPDHTEVVRNEQHRHPVPLLQAADECQDLGLHRDVERRGRFVGDQQVGVVGDRHGDHDALALAAGKLMRIVVQPLGGGRDADFLQQRLRARPGVTPAKPLVQPQRLADLRADLIDRVEARHRLLKDHPEPVAAQPPKLAILLPIEPHALEADA